MKKYFLFLLFLLPIQSFAQDWFEDTRSDGINVFKNESGDNLFSTRFNTKDGITINFFDWSKGQKRAFLNPDGSKKLLWFLPIQQDSLKKEWGLETFKESSTNSIKNNGWGFSLKTKAEQGIGSLISSGQFADGFSANVYYAGERTISKEEWSGIYNNQNHSDSFCFWAFTLGYTNNQYRFYRPDRIINEQLSKFESISGYQIGFSYFNISENQNKSNVIRGISLGYRMKNNYKKLSKVEIKDIRNQSVGKDSLKVYQTIDDDGYTYVLEDKDNKLAYFGEVSLKGHFGIIPKNLGYNICFLTYPEIVYAKSKASMNIGFGVQFLKNGQPLISNAGIFAKFSDIFNSASSIDPFLKRTFELGVTASLNILTLKAQ